MIAFFVRTFQRFSWLVGRSASVAVTAATASAGLMAQPAPALAHTTSTQASPEPGTWSPSFVAGAENPRTVAPVTRSRAATPAQPTPRMPPHLSLVMPASADWLSAERPVWTLGASVPPATHRMPGWLDARLARESTLLGQTSRPLHRAADRRPRHGNRPARRAQQPRRTPPTTVVWLASRA